MALTLGALPFHAGTVRE